ncbi:MAG: TadE/TadG family type IV pilus assembly protein [Actinomycetota bacterium]
MSRSTGTGRSRLRADDGDATLELLVLAPVVLILVGLLVAAGRTSIAQGSVEAAARDASRQASIARTPAEARAAAIASARLALSHDSLGCTPVVTVDVTGFSVPVGRPANVSAQVSCTVRLSDLLVPGLPGSKTLRASFTSPLDPYRGR